MMNEQEFTERASFYAIILKEAFGDKYVNTKEMSIEFLLNLFAIEKEIGTNSINFQYDLQKVTKVIRKALYNLIENEKCIDGLTRTLFKLAECNSSNDLLEIIYEIHRNYLRDSKGFMLSHTKGNEGSRI